MDCGTLIMELDFSNFGSLMWKSLFLLLLVFNMHKVMSFWFYHEDYSYKPITMLLGKILSIWIPNDCG